MAENFVLDLEVQNGFASRGDYVYWDGCIYIITDFYKQVKMVELRPLPRSESRNHCIVPANELHRVILETKEKMYDPENNEIQIGLYVRYNNNSKWQVIGFAPTTEEICILEVGKSPAELKSAGASQVRVLLNLSDKYGQLLHQNDSVIFDMARYKIQQIDIRRKTICIMHEQTGTQETVASNAVELISDTEKYNPNF